MNTSTAKNEIQSEQYENSEKEYSHDSLNGYCNIPQDLRSLFQWVCMEVTPGKNDKGEAILKKKPKNPRNGYDAKSNDSTTWGSFVDAIAGCRRYKFTHIGFAFSETDPYCGIDIDHCVGPDGELSALAQEILPQFQGTYSEYSTSGTGIHIIAKGSIPEAGRKDPKKNLEIYFAKRFFVFTGNVLSNNPIINLQDQINEFYRDYFKREESRNTNIQRPTLMHGDDEIIEKAGKAKNGSKFSALYSGDLSGNDGDHSAADQALCNLLAFWTKDPDQIDRIFRSSGLNRDKWEKRKDYREGTIKKAIDGCREHYNPGSKTSNSFEYESKFKPNKETSKNTPNQENVTNSEDPMNNGTSYEKDMNYSGIQFRSISELIKQPRKIDWLIKGRMDCESLNLIFGEPGSMKSFAAIDMGLCIASGMDYHGYPVKKTGSVFYIVGEGQNGIARRLKAWMQHNSKIGVEIPFFVSDRAAQFLDLESVTDLIKKVDKLKEIHDDPVLVIIDTLNRNFGNGDENSTKDMSGFISYVDIHIRLRYKCAVLIVHHTPLNDTGRARGASSLHGATDWEYSLKVEKNGTRVLTAVKVKDHESPPDICLEPVIVQLDGWIDEDGEALTSCVLKKGGCIPEKLEGSQKIALDSLFELIREGSCNREGRVHVDIWRDAAIKAGISKGNTASQKKAFKRAIEDLKKSGHVLEVNDCWCPIQNNEFSDL